MKKVHFWSFAAALLFAFVPALAEDGVEPGAAPAFPEISYFPELSAREDQDALVRAIAEKLRPHAKKINLSPAERAEFYERLRHYIAFLGLTSEDFKEAVKKVEQPAPAPTIRAELPAPAPTVGVRDGVAPAPADSTDNEESDDEDDTPSNVKAIARLFQASTQFLYCQDLTDWTCLETSPKLTPLAKYRIEARPGLGAPVYAGPRLEMETFFTQAWDGKTPRSGVVNELANRLRRDSGKSLAFAIYGIDEIAGSMKPVYDAIVERARDARASVRAVVDIAGIERRDEGAAPWIFGYVQPTDVTRWLFGPSADKEKPPGTLHALFQYSGTPDLIRELNGAITTNEQARLRVEWPPSNIMHNKFAVLESLEGRKAVWSGTANISDHCMGGEANSNMSIYIRNDLVAQAFLDHFNQMHAFDPALKAVSKLVAQVAPQQAGTAPTPAPSAGPGAIVPVQALTIGRFHHNKVPLSQRYFTFGDGTELRVHFAPTDDAEHRVILPMLLSAGPGDIVRVSMFGGTGYEIVRAFQYAAARGVDVRIVFDSKLGHGATSWIRDPRLNVTMPNPYLGKVELPKGFKPGKISVRVSSWTGKNHYKAGTLTRRIVVRDKVKMVAESIIVGSQNWSSGGNDENDENLVSIQRPGRNVDAAVAFNREFDNHLWVQSRVEKPRAVAPPQQPIPTPGQGGGK